MIRNSLGTALLICATVLCLPQSLEAENWPRFRGPQGQGKSTATNLPTTWSESKNIAWKVELPGAGWSSPIVWEDHVFVTATTNEGENCHVIAIDRTTGNIHWNQVVLEQQPQHKEGKNSHATPTPVTDGKRVYAVFGSGGVAAVNFDGTVEWTNEEVQFYSRHGLGSSPILYEGLVIMPFDGSQRVPERGAWPDNSDYERTGWQIPWDKSLIVALDAKTGKRVWTGKRGMSRIAHTTPFVLQDDSDASPVLISTAGDVIQAFNPKTGERLWSIKSQGEGVTPSPVYGDGRIYTSSGFEAQTIRTISLNETNAARKPEIAWERKQGVPTQPSMLYVSPYLYVVKEDGIAYCLDGATGEPEWTKRIGGKHSASPVYADGKIYILSEEGETTILAADPEFKLIAKNQLPGRCQASIAVSQGNLFVRTDAALYCIGE